MTTRSTACAGCPVEWRGRDDLHPRVRQHLPPHRAPDPSGVLKATGVMKRWFPCGSLYETITTGSVCGSRLMVYWKVSRGVRASTVNAFPL